MVDSVTDIPQTVKDVTDLTQMVENVTYITQRVDVTDFSDCRWCDILHTRMFDYVTSNRRPMA